MGGEKDGAGKRGDEEKDGAGRHGDEEKDGAGRCGGNEKAGAGKWRGDKNSNCPAGLGGLLKELNRKGTDESMSVKFELRVEAVCLPFRSDTIKRSRSSQNAEFLKDSSNAAMSDAEILSRLVGTSKVVDCAPNASC